MSRDRIAWKFQDHLRKIQVIEKTGNEFTVRTGEGPLGRQNLENFHFETYGGALGKVVELMATHSKEIRTRLFWQGLEFIAYNDDNGSELALDQDHVESMLSVHTLSETIGVSRDYVAKEIIKLRKKDA
jgi:hypothetical protein